MLEILAPAGDFECAKTAINNGANAVYVGYSAYSARQNAQNFTLNDLRETVIYAHFCHVKVYVAMNTIVKEGELEDFLRTLLCVWETGVDAVILQDAPLGKAIKEKYPAIVLHLSTQAGVCDENGAYFAKECGFSRVIVARETPLAQIQKIAKIIETEAFVQGALCTCFSGQCYFSSFVGGNSGNRGRCKQPCRKRYFYNRNGERELSYALSLSDLCVGEDIEKYIQAGVTSFKIEGRMRRKEYVASAVRYYRELIDGGKELTQKLSDLKRTYNRGNYTKGLAFGQDKRFLSITIQGHLGEKVGVIKVINGKYFVESVFSPRQGDAFKVLRDGKEIGGALFQKTERNGFTLHSKTRLRAGDSVFITTDTAVNERVLQAQRYGEIQITATFIENEYAVIGGEGVRVVSDERLQSARSQPLTVQEVRACFEKTDGLPVKVTVNATVNGNIFIAKSALNALRRAFFARLIEKVCGNVSYAYEPFAPYISKGTNGKTAVIADDFSTIKTDIAIYKPQALALPLPDAFINGAFEKYLYYPAFVNDTDTSRIQELISCGIDGVYTENYGGLYFAKKNNIKAFVGTGLNLVNTLSLRELTRYTDISYYAISKELTEEEQCALSGDKAFALTGGVLKLMDLCYCPFGKTCAKCDRRWLYALTDEDGREFPVRRYQSADGACRFEVYNCAHLACEIPKNAGRLFDYSLNQEQTKYTSGHSKRGVL